MNSLQDTFYPIVFLAIFFFMVRFMIQWIGSEIKQESTVTPAFWIASIIGASLMVTHTLIQQQYNVCVIQVINGLIYWRNLNLMKDESKQYRFSTVVITMASSVSLITFFFYIEGMQWARTPSYFWADGQTDSLSISWHIFGWIGITLFASRFWTQWLSAERHKESYLGPAFWWISLTGAIVSVIYFLRMQDYGNAFGPGFGIIPYVRNLMLLRKKKLATS